jgi:very-short-patch-repair endonuclease
MDRRTPVLVNLHETAADRQLREVAAQNGATVFTKVRLGDVLDLRSSGLSSTEFAYATRAHLDFVVCDADSSVPHFAVEMDGAGHDQPAQRARDRMKDDVCNRLGLEVLRVDGRALHRFGEYRLLGYLVEIWFLARAWDEAEARGDLGPYADFDPHSFISLDDGGKLRFTYNVSGEARARMHRAYDDGLIPHPAPEEISSNDDDGYAVAYAVMPTKDGRYLIAEARLRSYRFSVGLPPRDIAGDLALLDLDRQLDAYLRGEAVAVSADRLAAVREATVCPPEEPFRWIREGVLLDDVART